MCTLEEHAKLHIAGNLSSGLRENDNSYGLTVRPITMHAGYFLASVSKTQCNSRQRQFHLATR